MVTRSGAMAEERDGSGLHLATMATLHDLQRPSAAIYWADFLVSALAGWTAFTLASTASGQPAAALATVAATVLLYRAFLFIHELSHAARHLRGFTTAWNVLAGYPLLVPACFAVGVHTAHHRPSTYGTAADPEYLPFGRSRTLIVRFVVLNLAFPWLMALRFIVAGPIALLVPPLQRRLEAEATSLAMNSAYRRHVDLSEHRTIVRQQLGLLVLWIPVGILLWRSVIPARALAVWAVVASGIALVNGIRTLAAHKYEGNGSVLDREAQWADSIDTPGAWWTTIWAPVGHRYHALHHYVPGLPYHNLGQAYRRLASRAQAGTDPEHGTVRPSLWSSLVELWASAGGSRSGRP
jgi:fatty acid desaturase